MRGRGEEDRCRQAVLIVPHPLPDFALCLPVSRAQRACVHPRSPSPIAAHRRRTVDTLAPALASAPPQDQQRLHPEPWPGLTHMWLHACGYKLAMMASIPERCRPISGTGTSSIRGVFSWDLTASRIFRATKCAQRHLAQFRRKSGIQAPTVAFSRRVGAVGARMPRRIPEIGGTNARDR